MHKEVVIQKHSYLTRPYNLRRKNLKGLINGGKRFRIEVYLWRHSFCNTAPWGFLAGNSFVVRCRVTQKQSRRMHKYGINLTPPIRAWFSSTCWKFISIAIISRWTEFFWIRGYFMLDTWFHATSTHATRGSAAYFQCVCGRPS